MEFRVDETSLDQAAATLRSGATSIGTAERYAGRHVSLHGGLGDSGVFATAIRVLDDVRTALEAELAHLREITTASAAELGATAESYRATDDETDRRLDASYLPDHGGRGLQPL